MLAKHGARWHKNCRADYNQRMLDRAERDSMMKLTKMKARLDQERDHAERVDKFLHKRLVFLTVAKLELFLEVLHTSLIHTFGKLL